VWADFDPSYFPLNEVERLPSPHRAFVEIMKGCDKFCTFCVVPFTRGREVSRSAQSILEEMRSLTAGGVQEITLLGQNVNSYGLDGRSGPEAVDFPNLLRRAAAVEGLARLWFMTSHPIDLSDDLAAVFTETDKLGEYFHLPVQCGSDRILKRMNRKYTAAHYLDRVRTLKGARPEMCLSTDLIVGFPGETDGDFEDTLRLLDEVRFDLVYSFKYSVRQDTPAARMLDQVPEDVKDARLARLNEKTNAHAAEQALTRVGRVEDVMVEGPADRTPGAFYGKTNQNRVAVFPGDDLKAGDRVKVKVTGRRVANLFGDVVE
jgi:tRNA-2-methylthio-N6-dimethylallyladenosine synthase